MFELWQYDIVDENIFVYLGRFKSMKAAQAAARDSNHYPLIWELISGSINPAALGFCNVHDDVMYQIDEVARGTGE